MAWTEKELNDAVSRIARRRAAENPFRVLGDLLIVALLARTVGRVLRIVRRGAPRRRAVQSDRKNRETQTGTKRSSHAHDLQRSLLRRAPRSDHPTFSLRIECYFQFQIWLVYPVQVICVTLAGEALSRVRHLLLWRARTS